MTIICPECRLPRDVRKVHYCLDELKKRVHDLEIAVKCQAVREVKMVKERYTLIGELDALKKKLRALVEE